jgi:hypothetical protein
VLDDERNPEEIGVERGVKKQSNGLSRKTQCSLYWDGESQVSINSSIGDSEATHKKDSPGVIAKILGIF